MPETPIMEVMHKVESLSLESKRDDDKETTLDEEFIDMQDLRQALAGAEVQKIQQKLIAVQRQIVNNNNVKNIVPPKQLLLYLVR
jgi:hypothetical protein